VHGMFRMKYVFFQPSVPNVEDEEKKIDVKFG
jgi:hypothetical protein